MSNRDNPSGFTPRFHMSGGTIRAEALDLAAANTIIGVGDALVQTSAGLFDKASPGGRVDAIAASPAAASSGATILAYRDPNIVFSAQTDNGTGTATAQTCINNNIDFVTGSAVNGRSISELDESSATSGSATLPFKIRGLYSTVDNSFGQFNVLLFTINNHSDKGGTGTVGI